MDSRVDSALALVRKQRELVETTKVGSPAHRQATAVLALIEESHFLLSELRRVSTPPDGAAPALTTTLAKPTRRRRLPLEVVVVFVMTIVAAAVFLELADPASMSIQASEVGFNPLP